MKLTINKTGITQSYIINIDEPDISLTYYAETLTLNSTMFVTTVKPYPSNPKLTPSQKKKYRELIVKELTESK